MNDLNNKDLGNIKIAETGKNNAVKSNLSKEKLKKITKVQAQKIIKNRDPEMLDKIDQEVAAQAQKLKKVILLIGFVIVCVVVGGIIYASQK